MALTLAAFLGVFGFLAMTFFLAAYLVTLAFAVFGMM